MTGILEPSQCFENAGEHHGYCGTEFGLTVTASNRHAMDLDLDSAVAQVRERAVADGRQGILINRHAPDFFTVELSDEVPYGVIV
jgi:hypothetical protein